ncbi:MAG: hypothetical protein JW881_00865 [Spirochaetales bacterium]|nr:hypothetical protein [Spirochaetales bacterium]
MEKYFFSLLLVILLVTIFPAYADDEDEGEARYTDVEMATKRIDSLKKDNEDYRKKIDEIEGQIDNTSNLEAEADRLLE